MKKAMMTILAMGAFNEVMAHQNLIVNGDFSDNTCPDNQGFCIYNQVGQLKGWTPDPQIQIGWGSNYNDSLGKERVMELAPNYNSCSKQTVKNLQPGCYQLKFQWGARKQRAFDDSQFSVSLNGNTLKSYLPDDYDIHCQTLDVQINSGCQAQLKFCGIGGTNNSYGAFIKSVSLVRKPSQGHGYPKPPIVQIPQFPQINVGIPVLNPPVLTPPPMIKPPVLPPPPVVNPPPIYHPPVVTPPPFYMPNINIPEVNLPVLPPVYQPPVVPIPVPPVISYPIFDPKGFCMESHSGQCLRKQYILEGGEQQISFDYKVLTNFMVRDSAVVVTWDGQQIYKLLPCDSGKNIKIKVNASKGCHNLTFCVVGCPTQLAHQAQITNVSILQKQCVCGWGSNVVVNGDFEQNQCNLPWCLWDTSNMQPQYVPGWTPSPEIEIGKGNNYTNVFGTSWVAELDPNKNTCIRQKVDLKPGRKLLTFDWAARNGISYSSVQFDVKVNGQVLKSFAPADYNLHQQSIQFSMNSCGNNDYIEFCGAGNSDSLGAVVDNIKLSNWEECASVKYNKY